MTSHPKKKGIENINWSFNTNLSVLTTKGRKVTKRRYGPLILAIDFLDFFDIGL